MARLQDCGRDLDGRGQSPSRMALAANDASYSSPRPSRERRGEGRGGISRLAGRPNCEMPRRPSGRSRGFGALLDDFAFQRDRVGRKIAVALLDQEIVEAAAMLDRTQSRRGDAQAHRTAQRVGDQRHLAQVRQEARARLPVGMADFVAGLDGFARQLATARHSEKSLENRMADRRAKWEGSKSPREKATDPPNRPWRLWLALYRRMRRERQAGSSNSKTRILAMAQELSRLFTSS